MIGEEFKNQNIQNNQLHKNNSDKPSNQQNNRAEIEKGKCLSCMII